MDEETRYRKEDIYNIKEDIKILKRKHICLTIAFVILAIAPYISKFFS